jgi:hypothetical protein
VDDRQSYLRKNKKNPAQGRVFHTAYTTSFKLLWWLEVRAEHLVSLIVVKLDHVIEYNPTAHDVF